MFFPEAQIQQFISILAQEQVNGQGIQACLGIIETWPVERLIRTYRKNQIDPESGKRIHIATTDGKIELETTVIILYEAVHEQLYRIITATSAEPDTRPKLIRQKAELEFLFDTVGKIKPGTLLTPVKGVYAFETIFAQLSILGDTLLLT